tara:strand:- start:449 stop:865 length:417 start_codon:yes stop_codon:yes gene_type:complete
MGYKILSKFIKDISFEIPSVAAFALLEKEISKYNLNFDIKSKPFKNNMIEISTILKLVPTEEVKHKIMTEINYATIISIEDKMEKKDLEKAVLIDIPNEVYPTIYEVFVYLFEKAGVKDLSIKKEVNFEKMYNERHKN